LDDAVPVEERVTTDLFVDRGSLVQSALLEALGLVQAEESDVKRYALNTSVAEPQLPLDLVWQSLRSIDEIDVACLTSDVDNSCSTDCKSEMNSAEDAEEQTASTRPRCNSAPAEECSRLSGVELIETVTDNDGAHDGYPAIPRARTDSSLEDLKTSQPEADALKDLLEARAATLLASSRRQSKAVEAYQDQEWEIVDRVPGHPAKAFARDGPQQFNIGDDANTQCFHIGDDAGSSVSSGVPVVAPTRSASKTWGFMSYLASAIR
jgi:hypothetical protein